MSDRNDRASYLVLTEQVIDKYRHLLSESDLHIEIHPRRLLQLQWELLGAPSVVAENERRCAIPHDAAMRLGPMVIYSSERVPFEDVWLHGDNQ
jgi:hypothetical protein